MSIDPSAPLTGASSRVARAQHRRFHRFTLVIIGLLVLTAGGLAAVNALQGPRLSSAEINPQAAIDRPGQRLIIQANQPIEALSEGEWAIVPPAEADVDVQGNTITVRFLDQLKYNTEYEVVVEARGTHTGVTGRLGFAFNTPDVVLYSLSRDTTVSANGQKQPDRILKHSLSSDLSNEVVFEASRIQEYAALGDLLAVVTLDENNAPSLHLSSVSASTTMAISTPPARTIRKLQADQSADLFGYLVDGKTRGDETYVDNSLFIYDLNDPSGLAKEIRGPSGGPLPVMDWEFVPGTSALVLQGQDQQLYLVDPLTDDEPTPLGQHVELRGFIPGTTQLIVADPLSGSILDLSGGTSTTFSLPDPDVGPDLYPGKLILLDQDRYLQLFNKIEYSTSTVTSVLLFTDSTGSREVFRPASDLARIGDYCLSPNGEYLAVELIPREGEPDNYPEILGFSATTTYLISLDDGGTRRGISGFLPDWCR